MPHTCITLHTRRKTTSVEFDLRLGELRSKIETVPPQYHEMLRDGLEQARNQFDRKERSRAAVADMTADMGLAVEHLKFHVAACRRELQELDPEKRFPL
jgi:hypothetical protein